jgi:hypothetical protein
VQLPARNGFLPGKHGTAMQENGYVHVKELDSSGFRSICLRCYGTVAKSPREDDLNQGDANHICHKSLAEKARFVSMPPMSSARRRPRRAS